METTKIQNELAKMECNRLETLWCINHLAAKIKGISTILSQKIDIAKRMTAAKKMLLSDKYTEVEAAHLLVYVETYQKLARLLKNCTDLATLKEYNAIATSRINRVSKTCQNIAHMAPSAKGVVGRARTCGSNRVNFL